MCSTQREPLSLWVPCERLRHMTASGGWLELRQGMSSGKAEGVLCPLVGGFDAMVEEKDPQRIHPSHKRAMS